MKTRPLIEQEGDYPSQEGNPFDTVAEAIQRASEREAGCRASKESP
jgi:hypothetical protein